MGKGRSNFRDYYTKHHSTNYHEALRPLYVYEMNTPNNEPTDNLGGLRGCIDLHQNTVNKIFNQEINTVQAPGISIR